MTVDIAAMFGVLAGCAGVVDTVPYIRDILAGRTRPHRGTWFIWSVLALVVTVSQASDGAHWSLVMAFTQVVLNCLVFAFALRFGQGGVSRTELILTGIVGLGLVGWLLADEPAVTTAFVVAADLVAASLMVPKTYRDPDSETFATFALASLGGFLAVGATGADDGTLLLYPVYYGLVNGAMALLIVLRRRALRVAPLEAVRA